MNPYQHPARNRKDWRRRRAQILASGNPFRDLQEPLQNRSTVGVPEDFLPEVWELPEPDLEPRGVTSDMSVTCQPQTFSRGFSEYV